MQESREMYLETIYVLSKKKPQFRAIDICEELNYSKPSVSRAIKLLKGDNLVIVDDGGFITLTESGKDIAKKIFERHTVLTELFKMLGINEETANNDACKIEHILSDETFLAIKTHLKNYSKQKNFNK